MNCRECGAEIIDSCKECVEQAEVAKKIGIDAGRLSHIIRGGRVSASEIALIYQGLGMEMSELFEVAEK